MKNVEENNIYQMKPKTLSHGKFKYKKIKFYQFHKFKEK